MKTIKKIEGERIFLKLTQKVPANKLKKFVPALCYDICLKNGIKVGQCAARLGFNENIYYVGNIGYSVLEPYRGNGYAVEAVELLRQVFKKNRFDKAIITNSPENHASVRVCEKLGARFIEKAAVPEWCILREKGEKEKNIWELAID